MSWGRAILSLFLVGIGITVIAFSASTESEPQYQGRSLSKWLACYKQGSAPNQVSPETPLTPEAADAIAHIGTNAIPYYLKWLAPKITILDKVPSKFANRLPQPLKPEYRRLKNATAAVVGFKTLGVRGACAIPELTKLMSSTNSLVFKTEIPFALACLGKDALPVFLDALTNSNSPYRWRGCETGYFLAISEMSYLGTNARPALEVLVQSSHRYSAALVAIGTLAIDPDVSIPVLTNALTSSDLTARRNAAYGLSKFGDQARPGVPLLLDCLHNSDSQLHSQARATLQQIAPEVLTNTSDSYYSPIRR